MALITTLSCIIGRVLAIVDVINVKQYVDTINYKYTVTMAKAPPTVNKGRHIACPQLTFCERQKVK